MKKAILLVFFVIIIGSSAVGEVYNVSNMISYTGFETDVDPLPSNISSGFNYKRGGTPAFTSTNCVVGNCLAYDGFNDYIVNTTAFDFDDLESGFCMQILAYRTVADSADVLYYHYDAAETGASVRFRVAADGVMAVSLPGANPIEGNIEGAHFGLGHKMGLWFSGDGSRILVWYNNTLVANESQTSFTDSGYGSWYGTEDDIASWWHGTLDEVWIGTDPCTQANVDFSYNNGNFRSFADYLPVLDTCTAPGSGDWNVDSSDNCQLTTAQSVPGDMILTGTGTTSLSAHLTFTGSNQRIIINSGSILDIRSGGRIG